HPAKHASSLRDWLRKEENWKRKVSKKNFKKVLPVKNKDVVLHPLCNTSENKKKHTFVDILN
ncbi:hypothetical protein ACHRV5_22540, partial [Flavobacterium sp. FlaQc-52]|uniref:hypothetical protein n=1 Tax=Flavobacterium sp. FlaQc-52 TaxID=3374185 RepID=UPI003757B392